MEQIRQLFDLDFWSALGALGTAFYFSRLLVQWWQSERAKKPVLPGSYWYLSVSGALLLFVYSLARQDLIFLLNYTVPLAIYLRQLVLHQRTQVQKAASAPCCPHCDKPL
ncbi:MAG: lipid-A-disaccharide synthase N-terminal domain-containing protein [Planctomycetota bacterium]|jgi:lipid-A-disaccharide synthase-like uncharacterized protein